jgi:hypothetical protein
MGRNIYSHNFDDGDIITDTEFREIFIFSDKRDGLRAQLNPNILRLANSEEKQILKDSGKEDTSY